MPAPGADGGQFGVSVDGDAPRFVVGEVEVEPIELAPRRQIDDALDVGRREELAGEIDVEPAPLVRRAVDDPHVLRRPVAQQLGDRDEPVPETRRVARRDHRLGGRVVDLHLVVTWCHGARHGRHRPGTRARVVADCRAPTAPPDGDAVPLGRPHARRRRPRSILIAAALPIAPPPIREPCRPNDPSRAAGHGTSAGASSVVRTERRVVHASTPVV